MAAFRGNGKKFQEIPLRFKYHSGAAFVQNCSPISGESSTKFPIWGHHTQIHRFYGIKRWNTMRKKISDPYKPRKKLSRHAHESIKPCLYGTGALEVGAEKKSELVFFISKRALGGDP